MKYVNALSTVVRCTCQARSQIPIKTFGRSCIFCELMSWLAIMIQHAEQASIGTIIALSMVTLASQEKKGMDQCLVDLAEFTHMSLILTWLLDLIDVSSCVLFANLPHCKS